MSGIDPQFPLYIPSKGRAEYMITSRALDLIDVPHRLVVEPQEYEAYLAAVNGDKSKLIVLDMSYKKKYELCDELGLTKSTGAGPARNFIWDHSKTEGHKWHWVMDDNIMCFRRMNNGARVKVADGAIFKAMEDFVLRYRNVGMAGPNYTMFAFGATALPPFVLNTRIYSCNLIRNDLPQRWRGRYNEDTHLSLDILKAGWCTIQFNAFLQEKMQTQKLSGGNTDEFYAKQTRLPNAQMLANLHPDVARVVWKFGRYHHHVNYNVFKKTKLLKKTDVEISADVNEYGMRLVKK